MDKFPIYTDSGTHGIGICGNKYVWLRHNKVAAGEAPDFRTVMLATDLQRLRARVVEVSPGEFRTKAMVAREPIMQHFEFGHLPEALQAVSRPFAEQAKRLLGLPRSAERSVALRKLLESKDAAVRAAMAQRVCDACQGAGEVHNDVEDRDEYCVDCDGSGLVGGVL